MLVDGSFAACLLFVCLCFGSVGQARPSETLEGLASVSCSVRLCTMPVSTARSTSLLGSAAAPSLSIVRGHLYLGYRGLSMISNASPGTQKWLAQRVQGAIIGLALGDAAGGLTEVSLSQVRAHSQAHRHQYKTRDETQARFGGAAELLLDLNERTSSMSSGVATPPGLSTDMSRARWRADTDHTSACSSAGGRPR